MAALAIHACRGVCFVLLEEGDISLTHTGTAVWNHLRYRLRTGHLYARAARRSVGYVSRDTQIQIFVPFHDGNGCLGFIGVAACHATNRQTREYIK